MGFSADFAASLRPVFLVATGIAVLAFVLTWLLREVPLRQTARAEGVGESFASPRDDSSERELERIASSLLRGETRTRMYQNMITQSGLDVTSGEAWLLGRIRERTPIAAPELAAAVTVPEAHLNDLATGLERQGLISGDGGQLAITPGGEDAYARLVNAA